MRAAFAWWSARAFLVAAVAAFLLSAPCRLAAEDTDGNGGSIDDRAASFEAVSGAVKEDVPGGPLLLGAYAVVWLAVLAYVWRLSRLHARVEQTLGTLESALAKAAAAAEAASAGKRG